MREWFDQAEIKQQNIDPNGCIRISKNEIFRVVPKTSNRRVINFINSELFLKLIDNKYLIDTIVCDFKENDCMVLKHRFIPYRSRSYSWTYNMLKDAASLVINFNKMCNEYGYELKDAHSENVLFDGNSPVWVDFGSIRRRPSSDQKNEWGSRAQFIKHFIFPLALCNLNCENIAFSMMKNYNNVSSVEIEYILLKAGIKIDNLVNEPIEAYLELIESIEKDRKSISFWSNYQNAMWNTGDLDERFEYELKWIRTQNDIQSMTEIGANQGAFSYAVDRDTNIHLIATTDYDRLAIDKLYLRLKEENNTNIAPVVLDIIEASLGELKLYESDLLVANALTHHLLLTQGLNIDVMFMKFAIMARKYIIVEFMPKGVEITEFVPDFYCLDWFVEHMKKYFEIVVQYEINKMRTIIIGRKYD